MLIKSKPTTLKFSANAVTSQPPLKAMIAHIKTGMMTQSLPTEHIVTRSYSRQRKGRNQSRTQVYRIPVFHGGYLVPKQYTRDLLRRLSL